MSIVGITVIVGCFILLIIAGINRGRNRRIHIQESSARTRALEEATRPIKGC